MPLVLDLNEEGLPAITFETFEGGETALIYLGADLDNGLNFFADVTVGQLPGGGRHELTFHVLTRQVATGFEVPYWDGKETKFILPPETRSRIAAFIILAAHTLVARVKPDRIMMVTHDPDLPDRALVKYLNILQVFLWLGYKITIVDRYHGKRLWWAELPE